MATKKEILTRAVIALIIANALGYLLKFLKLDDYIILLGFRIKLNIIIPFLFLLRKDILTEMKDIFISSCRNKLILQLVILLLPFLIILPLGYLAGKVDLGDPEYFYEFGLSSIFDFPIYLLWNLPQLLLFIISIKYISEKLNSKTAGIANLVLFFAYEFIPVKGETFSVTSITGFLLASAAAGIAVVNFKNVISSTAALFFIAWSYFLFWGTSSTEAIHLLLASRFDSWEGLLWIDDKLYTFIPYIHFAIAYFGIIPASLLYKKKA